MDCVFILGGDMLVLSPVVHHDFCMIVKVAVSKIYGRTLKCCHKPLTYSWPFG